MNSASARQVGGDHYTRLGMQPFEFSLANGWDSGSHTVLKYVSRHHSIERDKAIQSLRKAHHVAEIMQSAMDEYRFINTACMVAARHPIGHYCSINKLGDIETTALVYLAAWLYGYEIGSTLKVRGIMVMNAIEEILEQRYGVGL